MGCGVTVLAIYAGIASLAVLILGSLLISVKGCDEESLVESCKDLKVDGGLTEVHNKILKFDILNQDNGKVGITGETCPVCSVTWFSTLEIVALTLLGVLGLANVGRCSRYMVKLRNKHNLKKENAKLQEKAETRRKILAELDLERGNVSVRANKDDGVPDWDEAVLNVDN